MVLILYHSKTDPWNSSIILPVGVTEASLFIGLRSSEAPHVHYVFPRSNPISDQPIVQSFGDNARLRKFSAPQIVLTHSQKERNFLDTARVLAYS